MTTALVIIDPQNSFCQVVEPELQQIVHSGELCVPGAWEAMKRLGKAILKNIDKIDDIIITLDSHYFRHIGHPNWFKNSLDKNPAPFTLMKVDGGRIMGSDGLEHYPVRESKGKDVGYTKAYIEAVGTHCIWPPHCIIGTLGHNIVTPLMDAILEWEAWHNKMARKKLKGMNPNTEHHGAFVSALPDLNDPHTSFNHDLFNKIQGYDRVYWGGQARSHCVAESLKDFINNEIRLNFQKELAKKQYLLEDAMDDVPGFEDVGKKFLEEMAEKGMKITTCAEWV